MRVLKLKIEELKKTIPVLEQEISDSENSLKYKKLRLKHLKELLKDLEKEENKQINKSYAQ